MKFNKRSREVVRFNTAAMPDIIFMLLFFFMVTTVVSSNEIKLVDVPEVVETETSLKQEDGILKVSLRSHEGEVLVMVDQLESELTHLEPLLRQGFELRSSQNIHVKKAVVWIDGTIPLSTVNELKAEMRNLGIYRIEYVHKKCIDC